MAGCMTVLQRCTKNKGYEEFHPRASLYILNLSTQQVRNLELELADLHEQLDDLTENKVTWDPYNSIRDGSIYQVGYYIGLIRLFDVVEWHNPNRVLMQFGVIQDIPIGVFLDKKTNGFEAYKFLVLLPVLRQAYMGYMGGKFDTRSCFKIQG
ncbi:hypothetical protein MKX01_031946 [Papaver californicum]|nr:hypothetical protein MKX01_031946 [Papaver californicum]